MRTLPKHKDEPEVEKPAYVTDVKFSMTAGIILDSVCPKLGPLKAAMSPYKHNMYHHAHGTDRVLEVAISEWNKYQEDWKARGIQHEHVPYPYTKTHVEEWMEEYCQRLNLP